MSDYFDRIEAHLLDAVERHAEQRATAAGALRGRLGVISRWLIGGRPALLVLMGVLILSGSAVGAVLLSGQRSRALSGVVPHYESRGSHTISVSGEHYEIEITPSLRAGTIGWCSVIAYRPASDVGGGDCATKTLAVGSPLFASSGEQRTHGLWWVITAPQVAAVRVEHGPTVLTRSEAELPYGYRAAVFQTNKKEFANEHPPQLTALDASGRVIPGGAYEQPSPQEETRYDAHGPAKGACSIGTRQGTSLRAVRGIVVTRLVGDPGIIGHAFLSCAQVQLSLEGSPVVATLLLNAKNPGARPAALPYTQPLADHTGLYTGVRDTPWNILSFVARRLGDTWLVVNATSSEHQAIQALSTLTVGSIKLPARSSAGRIPADAECPIAMHPLMGLQEVSQTAYLIHTHPTSKTSSPAELTEGLCTRAGFYLRAWALSATVLYPTRGSVTPQQLADREPVARHPDLFTMPAGAGAGRDTVERIGKTWLEIEGGSGTRQQRTLLRQLHVRIARSRAVARNPDPGLLERTLP